MIDFDVQRCTRRCFATERELRAGEVIYSVLIAEGANVVRRDYSSEAWQAGSREGSENPLPPVAAIGWWKSVYVDLAANRPHWAPNDVMLNYFERLSESPTDEDARYVLTLLLVRRRLMRVERSETDDAGQETLVLFCPRNEAEYRVNVVTPTAERVAAIQDELAQLLQTGSTPASS